MDESALKKKIVEWLALRGEVSALEKAQIPAPAAPMVHQDIVAGVKLPHMLKQHSAPVPYDHPHREIAAKFVSDVWKKNKDAGMDMSKQYLGVGQGSGANRYANIQKAIEIAPANVSEPMLQNRVDRNEPKKVNGPNVINPFRNILKSLQKRSQR